MSSNGINRIFDQYTISNTILDPRVPTGSLESLWKLCCSQLRLVGPVNRRKFKVIVVGSGLAGAAAAATLAEQGYRVECFCYQDSPRRAHSVAAQGGINAAKNYCNDGDSVFRLFYDTLRGGDFRSREASVYRLAELSLAIIDQCVAQGVPFAREYSGQLENRSFGGALVSRTFYARGQTGQQLLLGGYQALCRQIASGRIAMFPRQEMLDLIVSRERARGIVARNLVTGEIRTFLADAVVLASGGYANVYYLSTNAKGSNATAIWRAYRRGAMLANPCFTQIHPTCIPPSGDYQSKLTLMSESLRNDGRVWVPKPGQPFRSPREIPEADRDYFLERQFPAYGNLAPRDIASRATKAVVDQGLGVGPGGVGVYLDLFDAMAQIGSEAIAARYGNLFEMYERITGENPYQVPMRIYPAPHYTMGGLWVDYRLMSTIAGLFVIGEANFSDHGANRLGASALMQGLADGFFILPYTLADYLGGDLREPGLPVHNTTVHEVEHEVRKRIDRLLASRGRRSVDAIHRELGSILWDECGMTRSGPGLAAALLRVRDLRENFWDEVHVPGHAGEFNPSLVEAGRLFDFLELGELMLLDALHREESCGSHFRVEYQTDLGEPRRDDQHFAYVAAWKYTGEDSPPELYREPLEFRTVKPEIRSYR